MKMYYKWFGKCIDICILEYIYWYFVGMLIKDYNLNNKL